MRTAGLLVCAILPFASAGFVPAAEVERPSRPNVLLIAFDDLGDWIQRDPHEWTNLVGDPRHRETIAAHRRWLPEREAPLAPNFVRPRPSALPAP